MAAETKLQAVSCNSSIMDKPLLLSTINDTEDKIATSLDLERIPQAVKDACLARWKAEIEKDGEYRYVVSRQDAIVKLQGIYGLDWRIGARLMGDTRPTEEIVESVQKELQDEQALMLLGRVLNPQDNDLESDDPDYVIWKMYSQVWLEAIASRRLDILDDLLLELKDDLSEADETIYFQKQDQIYLETKRASAFFQNRLALKESLSGLVVTVPRTRRSRSRKHGCRGASSRSSLKSGDGDGDGEPLRRYSLPLYHSHTQSSHSAHSTLIYFAGVAA